MSACAYVCTRAPPHTHTPTHAMTEDELELFLNRRFNRIEYAGTRDHPARILSGWVFDHSDSMVQIIPHHVIFNTYERAKCAKKGPQSLLKISVDKSRCKTF